MLTIKELNYSIGLSVYSTMLSNKNEKNNRVATNKK